MNFLWSAFDLCAHGFKVHPLIPGRKLPILHDWGNAASDDENQIADWYEQYPNANIGVATGTASGVCVIDVDTKGGVNGFLALQDLAARGKRLPDAPVSITPTGGRHIWFNNVPGLTNCVGKTKSGRGLGVGIDFRGEGGSIVAPPSQLTACAAHGAGEYRWLIEPTDAGFPDLPDWAIAMLRHKQQPAQVIAFRSAGHEHDPNEHMDRIARFVAGAPEGQRNPSLYWATREALREGLSPASVKDRLTQAALACGLDAIEIAKTIQSGIAAEGKRA